MHKQLFCENKKEGAWDSFYDAFIVICELEVLFQETLEILDRRSENFYKVMHGQGQLSKYDSLTFPPEYFININGTPAKSSIILKMLVKTFLQNAASFFEYIWQGINKLYELGIKENQVKLDGVVIKLKDTNYDNILQYCMSVSENDLYEYVVDYNNQVKHVADVELRVFTRLSDMQSQIKNVHFIKQYSRNCNEHEAVDALNQIKEILEYIKQSYTAVDNIINSYFDKCEA